MGKTYRRFDGDWQDDHVYAEIRANNYLRYSWNRRHMPDDERKDLIEKDYAEYIGWCNAWRRGKYNTDGRRKAFRSYVARKARAINRVGYHIVMTGDEDMIDSYDWHIRKHGKAYFWNFY